MFGRGGNNLSLLPLIVIYSVDKYNYYNYLSVAPRIFKNYIANN